MTTDEYQSGYQQAVEDVARLVGEEGVQQLLAFLREKIRPREDLD